MYQLRPIPYYAFTYFCIVLVLISPIVSADGPAPVDYSTSVQRDLISEIGECAMDAKRTDNRLRQLVTAAEYVAEKTPNDIELQVLIASGKLATKDPGAAVGILERVCKNASGDRLDAYLLLSVAERLQEHWNEAIVAGRMAARLSPDNFEVQHQLYLCYLGAGDSERLNQVIAMDRLRCLRPEITSVPTMDPVTGGVICVITLAVTSIYYIDACYNDGRNSTIIVQGVFEVLKTASCQGIASSISSGVRPLLDKLGKEWEGVKS